MRKSDLKDGMIVETKESRYLVCDGKLIDNKGWVDLRDYTSELKFEGREEDEFTINKIFEIENLAFGLYKILEKGMGIELVWERKREIDWAKLPFGTKVIVADNKEALNEDCGEYVLFVGYNPKLERYPFIITHSEKDDASSYAYCMIDPSQEIKEDWYK